MAQTIESPMRNYGGELRYSHLMTFPKLVDGAMEFNFIHKGEIEKGDFIDYGDHRYEVLDFSFLNKVNKYPDYNYFKIRARQDLKPK